MKPLVDLLHLLLCQQPHSYDMMDIASRKTGVCYYYLEADIAGGDSMPDHREWSKVAENFKSSLNFKSDAECLNFVKEVVQVAQKIRQLSGDCPQKAAFIKTLLS